MNPDTVDAAGETVQRLATRLDAAIGRSQQAGSLPWVGPDADRYRADSRAVTTTGRALAAQLVSLADLLRREATQQRQASGNAALAAPTPTPTPVPTPDLAISGSQLTLNLGVMGPELGGDATLTAALSNLSSGRSVVTLAADERLFAALGFGRGASVTVGPAGRAALQLSFPNRAAAERFLAGLPLAGIPEASDLPAMAHLAPMLLAGPIGLATATTTYLHHEVAELLDDTGGRVDHAELGGGVSVGAHAERLRKTLGIGAGADVTETVGYDAATGEWGVRLQGDATVVGKCFGIDGEAGASGAMTMYPGDNARIVFEIDGETERLRPTLQRLRVGGEPLVHQLNGGRVRIRAELREEDLRHLSFEPDDSALEFLWRSADTTVAVDRLTGTAVGAHNEALSAGGSRHSFTTIAAWHRPPHGDFRRLVG